MSFYLNVLPQHPSKKGCQQFPPKNKHSWQSCKAYLFSKKTTFACVRVGCLTVKGLPDTALVADMAAIVANLRFNGLMSSFFFSGHEKSVKGRFGARNFDLNCFGVDKNSRKLSKIVLKIACREPLNFKHFWEALRYARGSPCPRAHKLCISSWKSDLRCPFTHEIHLKLHISARRTMSSEAVKTTRKVPDTKANLSKEISPVQIEFLQAPLSQPGIDGCAYPHQLQA